MATSAEAMQALVDKFAINMGRWNGIVNGDSNTQVTTDAGLVPSVAAFYKAVQIAAILVYPIDLATTGNVALTGEQTIDTVLTSASIVLVRANTNPVQNGVYLTAPGAWTRLAAFDTGIELFGQKFAVQNGSANKGKTYTLQSSTVPNVGVDALVFGVINNQAVLVPGSIDAMRAVGADIASASTVTFSDATGDTFRITGNTTINSFGSMSSGIERTVIFTGTPTITASSNILLPSNTNMVMWANDAATFKSLGSGVWKLVNYEPAIARFADLAETLTRSISEVDLRGRVGNWFGDDGSFGTSLVEFLPSDSGDVVQTDKRGRVLPVAGSGTVEESGDFSVGEIDALNAWALGMTAAVVANGNPTLASFQYNYNWIMEYGQSLSCGAIAHPPKSTTAMYGNVMIGDAVRSVGSASVYTPYGASLAFKPLIAAVTETDSNIVMNPSEIEALDWMSPQNGETSSVGFANFAKYLWNRHIALADDPNRVFVVTSTGRGGSDLSELSSGFRYDRTVDAGLKIKNLATAAAKTYGCGVILWAQGEADYNIDTPKATYKTNFRALMDNLYNDAVVGHMAQTDRPMIITYQTSGTWINDESLMISQAQLELAKEQPDVFMYGPAYPVTNKSDGHLDANGSRWLGMMAAKVWYRVRVLGQGWQPLHALKAVHRGNKMLIAFHTPTPPLQLKDVYVGFTATNYASKGITVVDDAGDNPVGSVSVTNGGAVLAVQLSRESEGVPQVYIGGMTSGGNTNIADSDSLQALFKYEYNLSAGDDPMANVAALVDKTYPLNNWAAIQVIASTLV